MKSLELNAFENSALGKLVSAQDWSQLDSCLYQQCDADLNLLANIAWERVPKREFGHGIETYVDSIELAKATPEQSSLVLLVSSLRGEAKRRNVKLGFERTEETPDHLPFRHVIDVAIETLKQCGVVYEGWNTTYLWYDPSDSGWRQIYRGPFETYLSHVSSIEHELRRPTIVVSDDESEARVRSEFDESGNPVPRIIRLDRENIDPQLWTDAKSIRHLFRFDNFEPNTPFWHALNILYWYNDVYLYHWDSLINFPRLPRLNRHETALEMASAAGAAVEIGKSLDALIKKPMETHALRGMKVISGAKRAASANNRLHSSLRTRRYARMIQLVPSIGVDNAAAQCEVEGLGNWSAIKRQWNRNKNRDR